MKKKIKQEGKIKRRILKQIRRNSDSIKELMKLIRANLRNLKKELEKDTVGGFMDAHSSALHILMDAREIAELINEIWILKMLLDDKFWEEDEEKE